MIDCKADPVLRMGSSGAECHIGRDILNNLETHSMSKRNIFSSLSAMPFAVLLMAIAVLMMLAGVLPIEGGKPEIMFRTPIFAAILGLLGLSILACVSKKKLKLATTGFHLVHIGVVLIMIGGLIAFIAEKRTTFHLGKQEKPTQHIQISENKIVDIGFSIQLKSFEVSHYLPDILLLKAGELEDAYRISEGQTLHLGDGNNIQINKITANTEVISYELDGDPQMMIYSDNTLWKQVAITGAVDSIQMPDGSTLLVSKSYNNLPTMQNKNFNESDYPTNPGLILRLMNDDMMSILTLPADGELELLSARDPAKVQLPDIRYTFPKVINIKLADSKKNGIASVNITLEPGCPHPANALDANTTSAKKIMTLLQDGGMLSRFLLPDGRIVQLSSPVDLQYHAEIEIDDLKGSKRTEMLGTNHPIDEQGWRFYLNSYDPKGVIITARHDPGNKIVVTGILAVMIGMPLIFFFRKRKKSVVLAVSGQKLRAKPEAHKKEPQHA